MKKLVAMLAVVAVGAALSANAADAAALYKKDCAKCHGDDGKGQTMMGKKLGAKDYSNPKVQAEVTDEAAFKAVKEGFKTKDGKVVMKPLQGVSDDEIKAIVKHMRSFKK